MCEALRDLMKNEIKEELVNARSEGEINGVIRTYNEVGVAPGEIVSKIMEKFSLTKEMAVENVQRVLGLQVV